MTNLVVLLIIVVLVGVAIAKLVSDHKKGAKCAGCSGCSTKVDHACGCDGQKKE